MMTSYLVMMIFVDNEIQALQQDVIWLKRGICWKISLILLYSMQVSWLALNFSADPHIYIYLSISPSILIKLRVIRIHSLYSLEKDETSTNKVCLDNNSKLYLLLRLRFWISRECGVLFHCHYSHVHYDPEWLYPKVLSMGSIHLP